MIQAINSYNVSKCKPQPAFGGEINIVGNTTREMQKELFYNRAIQKLADEGYNVTIRTFRRFASEKSKKHMPNSRIYRMKIKIKPETPTLKDKIMNIIKPKSGYLSRHFHSEETHLYNIIPRISIARLHNILNLK